MACQSALRLFTVIAFTIVLISQAPAFAPDEVDSNVAEKPEAAATEEDEDYYELYKTLVDTVDQVERNYVKKISRREIIEAAIEGIITKLDPHSSYIAPEELKGFKSTVDSQFGGIGIQVSMDRDQLKVASPLVGTPAYRAGLRAGDRIVKIEGESTRGISMDDAVRKLKGEIGTSVTLTVVHPGSNKEVTVTVQRELIHVETVLGDTRKGDDTWDFMLDHEKKIGYIRLTAFSRETAGELRKALEDLRGRGLTGLVLDLRFNPGGLLTSAIEISDMFLTQGKIVSTSGRNVPQRVWEASEPDTYTGFPMVVLVNRYSASASEIVSAALQDHNRAIVVGERTWGKGSVQNVIELEDHRSALKLTTASYQRPSGKNIHRFPDAKDSDDWGVRPNEGYELRLSDSELFSLVQHRKQRDIVQSKVSSEDADDEPAEGPKADEAGSGSADEEVTDRQLQKALEYLSSELARAN